ncbi:hypothetical protein ACFE04_000193 [Oxalis oulophora]
MNDNNAAIVIAKDKEEDYDDEEEDNMEVEELGKFSSTGDPDKMAKMQAILSQFTEQQMSRYESFRRSALQRSNMKRLLGSITGSQRISIPITIVVCGIAKMFVGELVETARMVMAERKDSGPIRPCHIREAFRRLKLEGRVLKRSVPRYSACYVVQGEKLVTKEMSSQADHVGCVAMNVNERFEKGMDDGLEYN